jgi:protein gp37
MSDTIEWTDSTWNPITGCTKVTPGCDNCYAETFAERWRGTAGHHFENGFDLTLRPNALTMPLRWRKPRKVFVNSMSDLFHKDIPDEYIARVFAVMALTPQHTYQVLTKRHGRMRSLLSTQDFVRLVDDFREQTQPGCGDFNWPLPNVWLGVSVEDQKRADLRIPALLETPAAVRFLSCEPLLGPVDLDGPIIPGRGRPKLTYWLTGRPYWDESKATTTSTGLTMAPISTGPSIDWVIVGGESGPDARPMHPDWARTIRNQCVNSAVPFLFKQWGAWGVDWVQGPDGRIGPHGKDITVANDGTVYEPTDLAYPDGPRYGEALRAGHDRAHLTAMYRLGKKRAGRELDGRTWDQFPTAVG